MVAICAAPLDNAVARSSDPCGRDQRQQRRRRRAFEGACRSEHGGRDENLHHLSEPV
jgi:hypothetical protein